jgi:predicted RecA/RadA family phage recombinase
MTAEAVHLQDGVSIDHTPTTAMTAGEVRQLPDGRACYAPTAIDAATKGAVTVSGIVEVLKTTSMVMLKGSRVFWDASANKAHLLQVNNTTDFYLGIVQETAAAAATTVKVAINADPRYTISLGDGFWSVPIKTAGPTACIIGHAEGVTGIFDATNEAQKFDALSNLGIPVGTPCLVEAEICLNLNLSAAAGDLNIGLANETHATDADSIAESLFIHLDGNSLNINAESDDGTTEVNSTDTTVDAVVGVPFLAQWDLSDDEDIQLYINGVNVLPSSVFKLNAATGPLKLAFHMEKTADTAVGNVTVRRLGVRTYTEV